jgi:hypothetical protein
VCACECEWERKERERWKRRERLKKETVTRETSENHKYVCVCVIERLCVMCVKRDYRQRERKRERERDFGEILEERYFGEIFPLAALTVAIDAARKCTFCMFTQLIPYALRKRRRKNKRLRHTLYLSLATSPALVVWAYRKVAPFSYETWPNR